ncbi:MAG: YciI family protein [Geminicoccaceae bacterium]
MHVMIRCHDNQGSASLRQNNRPEHLDYLRSLGPKLAFAGPLLDSEGGSIGSLLIVDVDGIDAANELADGDPFAKVGVFASREVVPVKPVIGTWLD